MKLSEIISEFNKCINALALELPEPVWNDVHFRWIKLQNELKALNDEDWVSVEDRLPEESEWVLAYCKEDKEHFARCCVAKVVDGVWFEYDGNHHNDPSVTHWKLLPTPPNIENKNSK